MYTRYTNKSKKDNATPRALVPFRVENPWVPRRSRSVPRRSFAGMISEVDRCSSLRSEARLWFFFCLWGEKICFSFLVLWRRGWERGWFSGCWTYFLRLFSGCCCVSLRFCGGFWSFPMRFEWVSLKEGQREGGLKPFKPCGTACSPRKTYRVKEEDL